MNNKQLITNIKEVLLSTGFEGTIIQSISSNNSIIEIILLLPYHAEQEDLEKALQNLQEELNAHDHKITNTKGKLITIHFGRNDLSNINFNSNMIQPNTLKIHLPSAFGSCCLDFSDGASCHLLTGGTTRMGKTSLLLYLSTMLYTQTNGEIAIYITSSKPKDYYPFENIQNVSLCKNSKELLNVLNTLITEYQQRNELLYSPHLQKATDSKSVLKFYPDQYHKFKPIFLIIDEYARFSDNKQVQNKVQELVESAGYLNIHVVISTQRPDAKTVLPTRIKANLLARICFTTTDKNNSLIILDREGAEKLGKIQGRAIYLDSFTNIIQIPYISYNQIESLLKPYKKEIEHHEPTANEEDKPRQTNRELSNKIQNMFAQSTSDIIFSTEHESDQCNQPSIETTNNGWFDLERKKRKR